MIRCFAVLILATMLFGCQENKNNFTYNPLSLPNEYRIDLVRIPQNDNYSCATTSLATIINFYENPPKPIDKNDIWELSETKIEDVRTRGNDVEGLERIAEHYNYAYSFMERLSFDDLRYLITQNIPVILFIKLNARYTHALVVNGYNKEQHLFYVTDPSTTQTMLSESFLENHWEAWLSKPRKKSKRAGFFIHRTQLHLSVR